MDGKQQPSNRQKQSYKTPACDWNIPRKESQQDESRRWGLVLLWINETTSTSPPLMSRTTEIRLYEEQMASKRHNGAVRNQTELQWLHFQSIFINMEDEDFFFPKVRVTSDQRSLKSSSQEFHESKQHPELGVWHRKRRRPNVLWSFMRVQNKDLNKDRTWLMLALVKHLINELLPPTHWSAGALLQHWCLSCTLLTELIYDMTYTRESI